MRTTRLEFMTILLDILYIIAAVFYLPSFFLKGRHRIGLRERFGLISRAKRQKIKIHARTIWLHAVSVGEIKAAAVLIKKISKDFPEHRLLLSTVTPTGNAIARDLARAQDCVIYLPFDLSWVVKKMLDLIQPQIFLIMETEIWPNLITFAVKKNIPVILLNGRISDKAYPAYKRSKWFFKPIIKKLDLLCMQSERDAKRIIDLGADAQKVKVVGNIKFDQEAVFDQKKVPHFIFGEKLIVAGSTHDNEEEQIVNVYKRLKRDHPKARLLLAPRHTNRIKEIEWMLREQGLEVLSLSTLDKATDQLKDNAVFVLDIMGVLSQLYQLADVVFVGGSLIPHGGQNPLEAAVWAKPIIFGKYMFNFDAISKMLLENNAAIKVENEEELFKVLSEFLKNPKLAQRMGKNAKELMDANKGSIEKIAGLIKNLL